MNEHVFTLFGGDKAEALRVVEPLHVSRCSHHESPFCAAFRRFETEFILSRSKPLMMCVLTNRPPGGRIPPFRIKSAAHEENDDRYRTRAPRRARLRR